MTFDEVPLTVLEQEVFCECGAWKNFDDLENSLSLDELVVLYEAANARQNRMIMAVGMAMGAEMEMPDDKDGYLYSDSDPQLEGKSKSHYMPAYAIDPQTGGEAKPMFGEEEVRQLPINLGYSIIE